MVSGGGFEEIVIDSEICSKDSIDTVLNGKHYNKSVRVHKTVLEALERLLFKAFQQHVQVGFSEDKAKKQLENFLFNQKEKDKSKDYLKELAECYFQFKQGVRQGK
ncbi:hypothetical protein ElyMa_006661300 [Elysia marginata]|uniref:Uncharacterized protein n=1 Tax=Elysia marginata TaxID=1093978 RepID=A0AAV4INP1_9GAST|nr:hypothetical protein ElyMa_006661300 [Elysia marginata]